MDKKKLNKEDFEYLCTNMYFIDSIVHHKDDNFEIENEKELTESLYKLKQAVKMFEEETGYGLNFGILNISSKDN